ncbi:Lipoprotein-releasing system transmembrane protein LolE [Aquisphaera giovannonii]|uniref:Lipoprotein-releasing system transmembrane protein LolE n=1 Tax=Aquisphaera giovannonii TaxID=406548 RepID=A0A5B9VZP2_9BACT|nr:FtsX-like permease family protein [Aquisphaera giovannonii]QEH33778.1 Lipoprotein-releasing system transmembrane protein LolE [Aquisphaera giovannonii]
MYKYLLCWRYLRTRYIALASIISVMLGVATMIVVNSVMAGFADKMRDRLHGVLADIVVESNSINDGFDRYEDVMARLEEVAGGDIVAMAATMETPGILRYRVGSVHNERPVQIHGVRPLERAKTGDFAEFLFDEKGNRVPPSFDVPEKYRENSPAGAQLKEMEGDEDDELSRAVRETLRQHALEQVPEHGAIIGYALATYHPGNGQPDIFMARQGSKVSLAFPKAGTKPEAGLDEFTVVGYFKSGMSEYDSTHVYVPLERLQYLRLLSGGPDDKGKVNQIQLKVRPGVNLDALAERLQLSLEKIHPMYFHVWTWEQKQGPLLGAVAIEQSILNILLFMIIAVAGFGILAIFSMIVVEKTRDIGVMKALGASTAGIRGIFLGYGLLLGAVGSGVGMVGGLLFVRYINEIEKVLSRILQHKVFDDTIYYFDKIPTLVDPHTVIAIVVGALSIAVLASIWPAQRAAKLHPVKALRFE